jgi:predicted nucleotide-binding protein
MDKRKAYNNIKFSARTLRKAIETCRSTANGKTEKLHTASVTVANETWGFDNIEEFLTSYASQRATSATLQMFWDQLNTALFISFSVAGEGTLVIVTSNSRASIESVFAHLEEAPPEERTILSDAASPKPSVFIGHGGNDQWEKLRSHLQDKHNLPVVSYETGARAGHAIRDILDSMAKQSSFAVLVLTGEDKTESGVRARQNVIHECGLFQGRLGFDRAILIVEEGVELASNFDGIQQLRFKSGHIAEVFGDVIATIRREFGPV